MAGEPGWVEYAECGVQSVENARRGKCAEQKMQSQESVECRKQTKYGIEKMRSKQTSETTPMQAIRDATNRDHT